MEAATGTYVKQSNMAPNNAKLKVNAIGRNIFPSTPLNDRMGINTIKIINWPKMAAFIIFEVLFSVILSFASWLL